MNVYLLVSTKRGLGQLKLSFKVDSRSGRYTGMKVTTGIVLRHYIEW